MKAIEKAKELIDKFIDSTKVFYNNEWKTDLSEAKKCALICADECIKEHCHESEHKDPNAQDRWIEFWQEVKQEINNL